MTTWVSWHQKGKPFWISLEQKYDQVAVASAGPYANHLHLAPCRCLKHPSTLPLSFLPARCPSCHPTDSVKALNAINALIVQLLSKAFIATKTPLFSDWQFGNKDNEIFTLEI